MGEGRGGGGAIIPPSPPRARAAHHAHHITRSSAHTVEVMHNNPPLNAPTTSIVGVIKCNMMLTRYISFSNNPPPPLAFPPSHWPALYPPTPPPSLLALPASPQHKNDEITPTLQTVVFFFTPIKQLFRSPALRKANATETGPRRVQGWHPCAAGPARCSLRAPAGLPRRTTRAARCSRTQTSVTTDFHWLRREEPARGGIIIISADITPGVPTVPTYPGCWDGVTTTTAGKRRGKH